MTNEQQTATTNGQQKSPNNHPRQTGLFAAPRQDFMASMVVFLVALPLCMGIAIASGVPVAAGLITGIVGGLVVGFLAGSPLQVSGPAAGLTVIVYEFVERFGFEMLGIVVLMAGIIQLMAGTLRLGQWFRAVSPAVIQGMLAGIGVLIFASQFHVMVDDKPKGTGLENLATIPSAIGKALTWPEMGTSQRRQTRTALMRQIGELHRRQAAIAERVAERLPDHAPLEVLEHETPEQIAADAAALKSLLEDQQALTAKAESTVAELAAFEEHTASEERSQRILAVCDPVIQRSRQASQGLSTGGVQAAMSSQDEAVAALSELSDALKNHAFAAQIGILTIAVILLWQAFAPAQVKLLPAPLIAILVAAGLATLVSMPVLYVEVPDNLWSEIHFPTWAIVTDAPWGALLQTAVVIAVVASAETLLCATALDQLHSGPRTKYDKELRAQGIGNMVCGIFGALPMTGVIVRSTANVQAGGKTPLSAILHGVWLLVFVVILSAILRWIPTSALAAILVYTGYKLVNPKSIKTLRKFGWGEVAIYVATVVTIVSTDLLTGVIVGVALAAAKLLYTFSHLHTELQTDPATNRSVLRLSGAATFVRLPSLAKELERVPPGSELRVQFQRLDYIDHACLDLLMNWAKQHESTGGELIIDWESLHAKFKGKNGSARPVTAEGSDAGNPTPGSSAEKEAADLVRSHAKM